MIDRPPGSGGTDLTALTYTESAAWRSVGYALKRVPGGVCHLRVSSLQILEDFGVHC